MKAFDPKNVDLIAILSENNRFEVPRFQRGYDWGQEQIQNFWLDLESVGERNADGLFFGNFIFLVSPKDENVLQIIDGQQRITTLEFLLIAIRQRAKILNDHPLQISNVNNLIEHVSNKFARDASTGYKKVTVSTAIRPLFDLMADFKWDGVIPERIQGLDGRTYRKIKNRVQPVYNFFYEKVKDSNTEDLAEILARLQKMFVTKIEIVDPQEAFDIFERTNARGVKLAQSDLVKNLLFQNADESLHDEIDKGWGEISDNSSDKLSQMLKYYAVSFSGPTLRKEIFPILNTCVKEKSSLTVIKELLAFSVFYKMMLEEGTSSMSPSSMNAFLDHIELKEIWENKDHRDAIIRAISAFQLFGITQIYPMVFSYVLALKRVQAEAAEGDKALSSYLLGFLERLEAFHFVNTVIGTNIGNQVEKLYADFAKRFSAVSNLKELKKTEEVLKKTLIDLRDSRRTFLSQFIEKNSEETDKQLFYYIFDRISNAASKGGQIYPHYNPDKDTKTKSANLEHFYPRKLFEMTGDTIGPDFGNNIGNLLVISRHSNSSFQHSLPADKYKMINSDPKFLMNLGNKELIIMKYEKQEWDKALIEQRATDLASYAFDTVWNVA